MVVVEVLAVVVVVDWNALKMFATLGAAKVLTHLLQPVFIQENGLIYSPFS